MLLRVQSSLKPDEEAQFLEKLLPLMPLAEEHLYEDVKAWVFDADPEYVRKVIGSREGNGLAIVGPGGFEPDVPELLIRFPSVAAASAFKFWLCNSGEQAYWDWMEFRPDQNRGPKVLFNYHFPGGSEIAAPPYPEDG